MTLAGLLVAFLLRLYRLGNESLWYDETVSAFLARQPFADMVSHTTLDIHPPGYYALLHAWATVTAPFGTPALEYLLAYPSLWFGLLSIALLAPIGRILLGHSPALLAVWLAAINPFQLWYAQEVRMYTVAAALGLLCFLAALQFTRATAGPHAGQSHNASTVAWLALYAVAAAAGLYTLYYFAFALLGVNLAVLTTFYLLSRNRNHKHLGRGALAWVAAQAGALLLFAAWIPTFARQVLEPPVPPWRQPWDGIVPALSDVAAAFAAYAVGQSVPSAQVWLWAALAVLLFIAWYGYTKSHPSPERAPLTHWLPLYLLAPPLAIFAVSALAIPIFHVRYLAAFAPAFSLIAAAGLLYLYQRRRARVCTRCRRPRRRLRLQRLPLLASPGLPARRPPRRRCYARPTMATRRRHPRQCRLGLYRHRHLLAHKHPAPGRRPAARPRRVVAHGRCASPCSTRRLSS